jgi:hypothetical protein
VAKLTLPLKVMDRDSTPVKFTRKSTVVVKLFILELPQFIEVSRNFALFAALRDLFFLLPSSVFSSYLSALSV